MKRLKDDQRNSCLFCKSAGNKVRAVWRSHGFQEAACDDHKDDLMRVEVEREQREARYTEADRQTWERL
ncbi:hypothetical protein [Marinobacter sp. ELB17]|uniref:hypothetical protein n=1 Tax=Marinobacter sp. ELB17 TaxID=270374 RepID=UPI0000F37CDE|nr:hypothetical protein [Marinobacter sp. ELB17]EAZ97027.1 hypothetical protein MELB17_09283 [Marinobacter sp. ELB17]